MSTSRDGRAIHPRICETERAHPVKDSSEVKPSIKKGRSAKIESPQRPRRQVLIEVKVRVRIELSHVIAVGDVNMGIFSAAYRQMTYSPVGVPHVGKQHRPAGAKVIVAHTLRYRVIHGPIIGDLERVIGC